MSRWFVRTFVISLFCAALCGCSGSNGSDEAKTNGNSSTEQAKEAIRDYGAKPIGKARAAQQAGEARTEAIDNALKQQ